MQVHRWQWFLLRPLDKTQDPRLALEYSKGHTVKLTAGPKEGQRSHDDQKGTCQLNLTMLRSSSLSIAALACISMAISFSSQDALLAQTPAKPGEQPFTVEIRDLSPKFIDFYDASVQMNADPDQRWKLWKEKYDFAAVPPIPAGDKMAREQLDAAWDKYSDAMKRLRLGAAALHPAPQDRLTDVARLLGAEGPIRVRLITFVGTFRRDAFAMGIKDGVSTIAIPLEDSDQDHALDMTHEFTHAVQMQTAGWNRQSVASAVFAEGLAIHVTQQLNPGSPENIYTTSTPEWLEKCKANLPVVLADLKDHSADAGAQAVSKFTLGTGFAGIDREVYCGGWFVVGRMLSDGVSYYDLGHMGETEAEKAVVSTIDELLASTSGKE